MLGVIDLYIIELARETDAIESGNLPLDLSHLRPRDR
jgi:hypothetical protein